jgi:hypothetical protein
VCGVLLMAPGAPAGVHSPARANLRPLWHAFPLGPRLQPAEKKSASLASIQLVRPSPADSDGSGPDSLLIAFITTIVLATGVAVLAFRSLRPAQARRGTMSAASLPFRATKGGNRMSNRKRKLWARDEPHSSLPRAGEQISSGRENSKSAVERVAAYSLGDAGGSGGGVPEERVDDEEAKLVDVDIPADPRAVGEEVGSVLQSAQEAAVRIRHAAQEEAQRLRAEAEAAAESTLAEARREAEADRAGAGRMRAEAEAYAKDTRAGVDAYAEGRRKDTEREAAQKLSDVQRRMEAADAEVEERIRQGHAERREQLARLEAEVERYEERLESMLVVFRGMSTQLEELLGRRRAERADAEEETEDSEALEEVLRPDPSNSHVG